MLYLSFFLFLFFFLFFFNAFAAPAYTVKNAQAWKKRTKHKCVVLNLFSHNFKAAKIKYNNWTSLK